MRLAKDELFDEIVLHGLLANQSVGRFDDVLKRTDVEALI